MKQIDVNAILEDVRNEIKEKGYVDNEISFDDIKLFSVNEISEQIDKMKDLSQVNSYKDVSSDRKVIGGLVTFVKKVIRRMTAFYVEPVVEDQNQYNVTTVRTVELLAAQCEQQMEIIKELRVTNYKYQHVIEQLEKQLNSKEEV